MVEVLIALIVIAVGLLGIAKLQALSLSSTGVARMRSLAATQASSLAAAMHSNRSFWGATTAPTFTVSGITVNPPSAGSAFVAVSCATVGAVCTACQVGGSLPLPCNATALASADVQTWANSLAALLPGDTATVTCTTAAPPVSCQIVIAWTENTVAANAQEAAATSSETATYQAAFNSPTYTLYVVP
jgi:type IV pilus assembly protein PilV